VNILFMTIGSLADIRAHTIYCDLLRCLRDRGHTVYAVCPLERRNGRRTACGQQDGIRILRLATGNLTRCGRLEKGLSTLSVERIFLRGIRRYFSDVSFDLILYSTPPVTFARVVADLKKRDGAASYLLLKDIFPQNAVDLGLLPATGAGGLLYRFFRRKEKALYAVSDRIGCMSPANVTYLLRHNPEIPAGSVEVCPNSVEIVDRSASPETRLRLRQQYGLPPDRTILVYGGNLGKPQGIDFLLACLRSQRDNDAVFFLIVGDGTEYPRLQSFLSAHPQHNVKLLGRLPQQDYDALISACDIGLIFLDHRFTIPNFPSRLLGYLQARLPVLACTDPHTDLGQVIVGGGFGWWCESNDLPGFCRAVDAILQTDRAQLEKMKRRAWACLEQYSVERACDILFARTKGAEDEGTDDQQRLRGPQHRPDLYRSGECAGGGGR
jgi:hypothetical protein